MKKLRQTDWGVITSSLLNTLSYTVLFYSSIRRSRLAADLTFQVSWLTQSWFCLEIFVYAAEFPTNIQAENTSGHHLMNNLTGHFTSPHLNDALGWFGPLSSLSLSKTQRLSNFQGWLTEEILHHLGCEEKPVNNGISSTNLNWWKPDFWTISSIPSRKLTWQWKIPIFNREYIFNRWRWWRCHGLTTLGYSPGLPVVQHPEDPVQNKNNLTWKFREIHEIKFTRFIVILHTWFMFMLNFILEGFTQFWLGWIVWPQKCSGNVRFLFGGMLLWFF